MKTELTFEGFEDLLQAFNQAASEEEITQVDMRIIDQAKEFVYRSMKQKVPQSANNAKSGRGMKGGGESRPCHGHARANIPVSKLKKSKGGVSCDIGWDLNDNSEYFYMKFVNWGTIHTPPRDFVDSTRNEADAQLQRLAESEYQKFLNTKLR